MKFWRTLVRVKAVYHDEVLVIVPGWDTQQTVAVSKEAIPFEVKEGDRLHAEATLGARFHKDMQLRAWEDS